jgi:hypothetical protein
VITHIVKREASEWEIELGVRGEASEESRGIEGVVELKSGLFLNGHAGLEAVRGHVLYSFSRETPGLPAFATRIDIATPGTGGVGKEDWGGGATAIVTRSAAHGFT